jgi:predicted nucleic acid-binding protein
VGPLGLPASGRVYLDTQVVVYAVEDHPQFGLPLRGLWQAVQAGTVVAVTSELTIMEVLVTPLRRRDDALVADYETFVTQGGFELCPISQAVLRQAASLRATVPSLRNPDAIHAATELQRGCALLLTNDAGLRRTPGIDVRLLSEAIS